MDNNTALSGAVISVYVYNYLWLFDANYTTDALGRSLIGFTPGYNYTFIASKPGFYSKNISIGEIIYPEYAIGLTGTGVSMEPILLFLFGGIALSLFIFSLGIRKISVSVISGVLCLVFAAMIWQLSLGFGIGFILIGIYSFIQIML
jgi:hypothetical protein